jgi:hypothetical protein
VSEFRLPGIEPVFDTRPDRSKPVRQVIKATRIDTPAELVKILADCRHLAGIDEHGMPFLAELVATGVLFTTANGAQPALPCIALVRVTP